MGQLPYEAAFTPAEHSREHAVPCRHCHAVRTFHTSAVCKSCSDQLPGDPRRTHAERVAQARGVHGTWAGGNAPTIGDA